MNINIISSESAKAKADKAYALFFVKESIQFSKVLSAKGESQVESVLKGIKDGPFEDLEFLEIDGCNTFFVDAAKERGLSTLDHLRMAAYRLAQKAMKREIDFLMAKAQIALDFIAGMPVISDNGEMNLRKARHPLLERA
ncbi:MAG: hypothetical protein IJ977_02575, partial [Fibrobacter sp.]|nr:hypothetical protein [Fibrobacter sp.]